MEKQTKNTLCRIHGMPFNNINKYVSDTVLRCPQKVANQKKYVHTLKDALLKKVPKRRRTLKRTIYLKDRSVLNLSLVSKVFVNSIYNI